MLECGMIGWRSCCSWWKVAADWLIKLLSPSPTSQAVDNAWKEGKMPKIYRCFPVSHCGNAQQWLLMITGELPVMAALEFHRDSPSTTLGRIHFTTEPMETWKRHIIRQLKHRDKSQKKNFQDVIRSCMCRFIACLSTSQYFLTWKREPV